MPEYLLMFRSLLVIVTAGCLLAFIILQFYLMSILKTIAILLHQRYPKVYMNHFGSEDPPDSMQLNYRGTLPYIIKGEVDLKKDSEMDELIQKQHRVFVSSFAFLGLFILSLGLALIVFL